MSIRGKGTFTYYAIGREEGRTSQMITFDHRGRGVGSEMAQNWSGAKNRDQKGGLDPES